MQLRRVVEPAAQALEDRTAGGGGERGVERSVRGHPLLVPGAVLEVHRRDREPVVGREALGFAQSDWIETDVAGMPLTVRFYHCNPRHHSLAIGTDDRRYKRISEWGHQPLQSPLHA